MKVAVPRHKFTAVFGLILWTGLLAVPAVALATDAAALLSRARAFREAGKLEEAAATLQELLVAARGSDDASAGASEAHRELGGIYEALNRPREAAAQYEMSLAADPRQPVLRYRAGILYRQLSEPAQAARHLDESFKQGFQNTGVQFHLAAAQFASGQFAAGLENARAILQRGPPSGALASRVGRLLFEHLFYRDAIEAFEAALERSGEALDTRLFLALANFLLNRHLRAIEVLEPLTSPGGSGTAEALALLASALASLDRFDESEAVFERAIAKEPSSPHAYLNLALVLLEQGEADAAERWLSRMGTAARQASPKVFYAIRRNSCEDAHREAVRDPASDEAGLDPRLSREFFEFGRALNARHHYGTAVELLRLAARRSSDGDLPRPRLLRALGFSCLNLEPESEMPARLLQRSVELDPQSHESHFLLGFAYQKRYEPARSAAAFERAIQLKPDSAAYRTALGRLLSGGRPDSDALARADEVLRQAIEIGPLEAAPRYELAKLWMRQGRLAEAEDQLRQAIEAEPEFYEPYYLLGQIHAREGRLEDARQNLQLFESKKAASEARSTVWQEAATRLVVE